MIKFFIHVHRILGLLLCVLCFLWCISGIVLIYHSFPRVGPDKRLPRQEVLDTSRLPDINEIWQRLPKNALSNNLNLNNPFGEPVFHYGRWRNVNDVYVDSNYILPSPIYALCEQRAKCWCPDRKITGVDTLHKLEVWIPFGQLKRDLPIYKFYFDGPEHYQLYISSRTGNILQFSSREQRFWAWIGGHSTLVIHYLHPTGYTKMGCSFVLELLAQPYHVYQRNVPRHSFLLADPPERLPSFSLYKAVVPLASHHRFLFRYLYLYLAIQCMGAHITHLFQLIQQKQKGR